MKIRAVDSCVLTVPTPKPIALQFPQHKLVVAEISTDAGVSGLGYSLAFGGGGAEAIQVYLDTRLKPVLIGEDPLFVERLWERMFRADMGISKQGRPAYALSGLDTGLWDLAGKVAGDVPQSDVERGKGVGGYALLDIGLWDIAGKVAMSHKP